MEKVKKLLEQRKTRKKVQPTFVVKESKFSARVKTRWRFPRGKHSAVRQHHKGRPALPTPGYGSPKEVKFLHHTGMKPVLVCCEKDLLALNNDQEGAILSATLGTRKKLSLLKLAQEKKITLLNIADSAKLIDKITAEYAAKLKERSDKKKAKSKKVESRKKKAEEKKKESEAVEKKEAKSDESVEDKIKEEEEQKKVAERTIIKKQ